MSGYAANVPLRIGTGVINLDFKGGLRVKVVTSDSDGLKMRLMGFQFTAVSSVLGTVTLQQDDNPTTPLSILQMSSTVPASPENKSTCRSIQPR